MHTKLNSETGNSSKPSFVDPKAKHEFTPRQLEAALAYAEGVMESCALPFFLMDELCEFVVKNTSDTWLIQGSVDTITFGVRRNEVRPEAVSTFKTIVSNWGTMPNEWQFEYQEVPIRVTIVNRDYKYLHHLDTKFHLASEFKIPNPFEKYWATRYLVK